MPEQINFTENISKLLEEISKRADSLRDSRFVAGLSFVFAYLEGNIQEKSGRIVVKKTPELFETLKDLDLSIYGIALLRNERGELFLFDTNTGFSLKLYSNDDWNYYLVNEPSFESGFLSAQGVTKIPQIGDFFEVSKAGRISKSRIVEIAFS